MENYTGQQIGNYRIISKLGEGGFAKVYRGEHIYLNTPIAIKLLLNDVDTKEHKDAFLKEAQIVARLEHPQIVHVSDFGIHKDTAGKDIPYLIMEYAPNGTLHDKYPYGICVPLQTVISYVNQLAAALQYAHDKKVIHRDIKPQNMLLDKNNNILLSDFGIALIAHSSKQQKIQSIVGTAAYMSPEHIKGKPQFASDQYSFGIVVYQWLCGSVPFHGNFTEICTQHLYAAPPPLHEKVPDIPLEVEQVVLKALAKDPEQRYNRVEDFATALELASKSLNTSSPSIAPTIPIKQRERSSITLFANTAVKNNEKEQEVKVYITQDKQDKLLQDSFNTCWRKALQAQTSGNEEEAFNLLKKLTKMSGLTLAQAEAVKKQLRELRKMVPLLLQKARNAHIKGQWEDEICAWEDLLNMNPTDEIEEIFCFNPQNAQDSSYFFNTSWKHSIIQAIEKRITVARHNKEYAWMYEQAQQFIHEHNEIAARKQLERLWEDAPYYGDPDGLAQKVGLSARENYEQALTSKLEEWKQKAIQEQLDELRRQEQIAISNKRKDRKLFFVSCLMSFLIASYPVYWGWYIWYLWGGILCLIPIGILVIAGLIARSIANENLHQKKLGGYVVGGVIVSGSIFTLTVLIVGTFINISAPQNVYYNIAMFPLYVVGAILLFMLLLAGV